MQLSRGAQTQGPLRLCSSTSAEAESPTSKRIHLQGSPYRTTWVSHTVIAGFPKETDPRGQGRSYNAFCDPASKFVCCHIHHTVLVTQFNHLWSPWFSLGARGTGKGRDTRRQITGGCGGEDCHTWRLGLTSRSVQWQSPWPCCASVLKHSLWMWSFWKGYHLRPARAWKRYIACIRNVMREVEKPGSFGLTSEERNGGHWTQEAQKAELGGASHGPLTAQFAFADPDISRQKVSAGVSPSTVLHH